MTSIRFEDYSINKLKYELNPHFNPETTKIDITPTLDFGIKISKISSEIYTKLGIALGNLESEDAGFILSIEIVGTFTYDEDEINSYGIEFETFIKESTISILWSFIRPTVSDIISRGNKFPNYILPVVNVAKLVKENNIQIEYENEE